MKHKHAFVLIAISLLLALMLPMAAPAQTAAPPDPDAPQTVDSLVDHVHAFGLPHNAGASSQGVPDAHPQGTQFSRWCNTAPISIPDQGAATPYPSTIPVAGLQGIVAKAKVHVLALSHTEIMEVDILLVGPQGQNLILMSYVGTDSVSNINLTFDDDAANTLPFFGAPTSGSYRPTSFRDQPFPPPAPALSMATALAVFDGTDPNGGWALYVVDREAGDAGQIGSWCMDLEIIEVFPAIAVEPTQLHQTLYLDKQTTELLGIANEGDADLVWALANSTAVSSPLYYRDRAMFDATFPGLPVEDFEAGLWEDYMIVSCPAPWNALTNNACFQPGGILPGISFQDDPLNGAGGGNPDGLTGVGAGISGATSKNIVANTYADAFEILFDPPVHAAGMDLIHYHTDATVVDITIYDANDVKIATTQGTGSNAGTFWGVYSATPMGRIHILSPLTVEDGAEGVDNVAFGQVGTSCSAPEDLSWLSVSPTEGVVPVGEAVSLDVTFDSTGLTPDTYTGTLCITSNAPLRPLVEIPLALNVTLHLVRFPIMAR